MRPSLGFSMDSDNAEITTVRPGSVAERADLRVGDILLALDDLPPLEFLSSAWWPRIDDKPVLAKLQRGARIVWRVLAFEDGESMMAPPLDAFAGMFGQDAAASPARGTVERSADTAKDEIAALRRAVGASRYGQNETEFVGVAPGHEHLLYGGTLPDKRAADKAAIGRQRAEVEGWNRSQFGAPPMQEGNRPRDDGPAERMWLERHGRTGREPAPPMGNMRPGWSWTD